MIDFTSFYHQHLSLLKSLAAQHCLNKQDTEDAIQDISLDFWLKSQSGKIDPTKNPKTFLSILARWRMKDRCRFRQRHENNTSLVGGENNLDELIDERENNFEQIEVLSFALKEIFKESKQRDIRVMKDFLSGKNISTTAKTLDITPTMTYVIRHRMSKKVIERAKQLL